MPRYPNGSPVIEGLIAVGATLCVPLEGKYEIELKKKQKVKDADFGWCIDVEPPDPEDPEFNARSQGWWRTRVGWAHAGQEDLTNFGTRDEMIELLKEVGDEWFAGTPYVPLTLEQANTLFTRTGSGPLEPLYVITVKQFLAFALNIESGRVVGDFDDLLEKGRQIILDWYDPDPAVPVTTERLEEAKAQFEAINLSGKE